MDALVALDRQFFLFIHQTLKNPAFDFLMPWLREKYLWIPLYAAVLTWLIFRFRVRGLIVAAGAVLTAAITDQTASSVIKPLVERLRPCQDTLLLAQVQVLVPCGGGYSFVSSHAANHFGLAVFFIVLFGRKYHWLAPAAILWATAISFAQVYVGVHYPLDVICGALLGFITAFITGRVCRRVFFKYGAGQHP